MHLGGPKKRVQKLYELKLILLSACKSGLPWSNYSDCWNGVSYTYMSALGWFMADLTDSTFTYKTMIWDIYDFGRLIQIFIMCLNGKKTIITYSNVMDFFFRTNKSSHCNRLQIERWDIAFRGRPGWLTWSWFSTMVQIHVLTLSFELSSVSCKSPLCSTKFTCFGNEQSVSGRWHLKELYSSMINHLWVLMKFCPLNLPKLVSSFTWGCYTVNLDALESFDILSLDAMLELTPTIILVNGLEVLDIRS